MRGWSSAGPAGPLCRKIVRCAPTSTTSAAGISHTCRPKKRLIVAVPIAAAALRDVLHDRTGERPDPVMLSETCDAKYASMSHGNK